MVVFGYEFPHFKTEYGIKELILNKFNISLVVLQRYKKLSVKSSKKRVYPYLNPLGNIKEICEMHNIKYIVSDHDSKYTVNYLRRINPQLGIILGARILKKKTIECFSKGILNLHPGEIPINRGLDNFKWAIINQYPMIVTAHLISEKIDLGKIIKKSEIKILEDDTIFDFSLRHFFNEFKVMIESVKILDKNPKLIEIQEKGKYFKSLPNNLDKDFDYFFQRYKKRFLS